MNRDFSALVALTASLIRRLIREGMVLRSLVWPSGLTAGTLLLTLAVVAFFQTSTVVALSPAAPADLRAQIAQEGWSVLDVADLDAAVVAVEQGDAWVGSDGQTLVLRSGSEDTDRMEIWMRAARGSSWTTAQDQTLPGTDATAVLGARIVRIVFILFALYGVVFGLGSVARDRDDGTLEAELSLPIARWVPGAARWTAATTVLTVFLGYAIAIFAALVGVDRPVSLLLHGFAAAGGAVSLGIGAVGRAGLKQGFAGPLAFGLTGATGLIALGAGLPAVGRWLPLCSLMTEGNGIAPAVVTLLGGVAASAMFGWRSGQA